MNQYKKLGILKKNVLYKPAYVSGRNVQDRPVGREACSWYQGSTEYLGGVSSFNSGLKINQKIRKIFYVKQIQTKNNGIIGVD